MMEYSPTVGPDNTEKSIGVLVGTQSSQILTILNNIFLASSKTLMSGEVDISSVKIQYDNFFNDYPSKNKADVFLNGSIVHVSIHPPKQGEPYPIIRIRMVHSTDIYGSNNISTFNFEIVTNSLDDLQPILGVARVQVNAAFAKNTYHIFLCSCAPDITDYYVDMKPQQITELVSKNIGQTITVDGVQTSTASILDDPTLNSTKDPRLSFLLLDTPRQMGGAMFGNLFSKSKSSRSLSMRERPIGEVVAKASGNALNTYISTYNNSYSQTPIVIDLVVSSALRRSQQTLLIILNTLQSSYKNPQTYNSSVETVIYTISALNKSAVLFTSQRSDPNCTSAQCPVSIYMTTPDRSIVHSTAKAISDLFSAPQNGLFQALTLVEQYKATRQRANAYTSSIKTLSAVSVKPTYSILNSYKEGANDVPYLEGLNITTHNIINLSSDPAQQLVAIKRQLMENQRRYILTKGGPILQPNAQASGIQDSAMFDRALNEYIYAQIIGILNASGGKTDPSCKHMQYDTTFINKNSNDQFERLCALLAAEYSSTAFILRLMTSSILDLSDSQTPYIGFSIKDAVRSLGSIPSLWLPSPTQDTSGKASTFFGLTVSSPDTTQVPHLWTGLGDDTATNIEALVTKIVTSFSTISTYPKKYLYLNTQRIQECSVVFQKIRSICIMLNIPLPRLTCSKITEDSVLDNSIVDYLKSSQSNPRSPKLNYIYIVGPTLVQRSIDTARKVYPELQELVNVKTAGNAAPLKSFVVYSYQHPNGGILCPLVNGYKCQGHHESFHKNFIERVSTSSVTMDEINKIKAVARNVILPQVIRTNRTRPPIYYFWVHNAMGLADQNQKSILQVRNYQTPDMAIRAPPEIEHVFRNDLLIEFDGQYSADLGRGVCRHKPVSQKLDLTNLTNDNLPATFSTCRSPLPGSYEPVMNLDTGLVTSSPIQSYDTIDYSSSFDLPSLPDSDLPSTPPPPVPSFAPTVEPQTYSFTDSLPPPSTPPPPVPSFAPTFESFPDSLPPPSTPPPPVPSFAPTVEPPPTLSPTSSVTESEPSFAQPPKFVPPLGRPSLASLIAQGQAEKLKPLSERVIAPPKLSLFDELKRGDIKLKPTQPITETGTSSKPSVSKGDPQNIAQMALAALGSLKKVDRGEKPIPDSTKQTPAFGLPILKKTSSTKIQESPTSSNPSPAYGYPKLKTTSSIIKPVEQKDTRAPWVREREMKDRAIAANNLIQEQRRLAIRGKEEDSDDDDKPWIGGYNAQKGGMKTRKHRSKRSSKRSSTRKSHRGLSGGSHHSVKSRSTKKHHTKRASKPKMGGTHHYTKHANSQKATSNMATSHMAGGKRKHTRKHA